MSSYISKSINEVINLVKDVPEEYRKSSFEILLAHFLSQRIPSFDIKQKKQPVQKHSKTDEGMRTILNSKYDWAFTGIKDLKGLTQYIHILDVVEKKFKIDSLSASNIAKILEQKFRLKKKPTAISMSLMSSVGECVDRSKVGYEYKYTITVLGRKKLKEVLEGNEN